MKKLNFEPGKLVPTILQSVKCVFVWAALYFVFLLLLSMGFYYAVWKLGLDVFDDSGQHFTSVTKIPGWVALVLAGFLTVLLERKKYLADGRRLGRIIVVCSFVFVFLCYLLIMRDLDPK